MARSTGARGPTRRADAASDAPREAGSKLDDEPGRLAALRRYNVLDTATEGAFDKLTDLVRTILNMPICAVTLIDSERQWFKSRAGIDITETLREISFCTHTIAQCGPLIIEDAKTDSRFQDNPLVLQAPFIGSYAGVPLRTPDGYNIGALCVIDTVPRTFDPAEIEILQRFAGLVFDELELRQAAQRDFLTLVMTRRAIVNEADCLIAMNKSHGRPSALIMFDVDYFKSINDRYGHPGGDTVLKEIAARAGATLRAGDSIGRIGGEEFAVLTTDTDAVDAMRIAERLRAALADSPFALDTEISVTASFGVATCTPGMDSTRWFAAADAALYRAKNEGRNRCVLATQPGIPERRLSA